MTHRYDALVVGARCAGASTAMLLARSGLKVLVVDRAPRGSDTLSTHDGGTAAEPDPAVLFIDHSEYLGGSGVSLATVRTHVQRAFDKTGTHRRADLVRLILAYA